MIKYITLLAVILSLSCTKEIPEMPDFLEHYNMDTAAQLYYNFEVSNEQWYFYEHTPTTGNIYRVIKENPHKTYVICYARYKLSPNKLWIRNKVDQQYGDEEFVPVERVKNIVNIKSHARTIGFRVAR